jgi:RecA-family ATPase
MKTDLTFGRTWADATHTWEELHGKAKSTGKGKKAPKPAPKPKGAPAASCKAASEAPPFDLGAAATPRTEPPPAPSEAVEVEPAPGTQAEPPPRPNGHDYTQGGDKAQSLLERRHTYQSADRKLHTRVDVYRDAAGVKTCPTYHYNGRRWVKGWPDQVIPYRLPELLDTPPDEPICITEGEKDADTLAGLGFVVTTNPGGADKWQPELNEWFRGRAQAYVFEDNDAAGRAHTRRVIDALRDIVPTLIVMPFPELPEHGDVSDWATAGGNQQLLLARMEEACKRHEAAPIALPYINMSNWDQEPVPEQPYTVPDRIPQHEAAMFHGEGAAGKSTIGLHLCAAHVLGREWLGVMPEPGPAIFADAEDGEIPIHRRLAAIGNHYGATFGDMIKGGLHLISLAGQDAILATASRSGKIEPTALYAKLLEAAGDIKPKMITIASLANVYAGSEIDRSQVQQFVGLLTRLAIRADGSVTQIAHPSLTGINSGTGLSGSTQWHNAVRARFYLKGVKPEDGELPDNDLREIEFKKNQYGQISGRLVLRYQNGLFLPEPGVASLDQATQELTAQDVFLTLLKRLTAENRHVSASPSKNYAPTCFARESEARAAGLTNKQLETAMRELFRSGKVWNEPCGKPSRPSFRIAVKA